MYVAHMRFTGMPCFHPRAKEHNYKNSSLSVLCSYTLPPLLLKGIIWKTKQFQLLRKSSNWPNCLHSWHLSFKTFPKHTLLNCYHTAFSHVFVQQSFRRHLFCAKHCTRIWKKDMPCIWETGAKNSFCTDHLKDIWVFEPMQAILCDRDSLRATGRLIK